MGRCCLYFPLMDNIIMERLKTTQLQRKESLGEFLQKKAEILRHQRIKDGLMPQEVKEDFSVLKDLGDLKEVK